MLYAIRLYFHVYESNDIFCYIIVAVVCKSFANLFGVKCGLPQYVVDNIQNDNINKTDEVFNITSSIM